AIANAKTSTEKLLKLANHFKTNFKNSATRGGCPILNTAVGADHTHPLLKEKAGQSFTGWKKNIEAIIKQGIVSKEIKATVNASDFAIHFIALVEGGMLLARSTGNLAMLSTCIGLVENIIHMELEI
ncbi:MAG: hypothetical protein Q7T76_02835, partial [Ferruginibacter sp.]|nr:hypothetical protein [Ferruginibacter sp.]